MNPRTKLVSRPAPCTQTEIINQIGHGLQGAMDTNRHQMKGNYIVGLYEYKHGGRYFNEKHPWQMMATTLMVSEEQRASSRWRDWRGRMDVSGR